MNFNISIILFIGLIQINFKIAGPTNMKIFTFRDSDKLYQFSKESDFSKNRNKISKKKKI